MSQLSILKSLLGSTTASDEILQFYLDDASAIICDIRYSDIVEPQYMTTQIKIALELFSKRGAEGEISHTELGTVRMYERSDVSPSLIQSITPFARTPFSTVRVIGT